MNRLMKFVAAITMIHALAFSQGQDRPKDPCDHPMTTVEMRECAGRKFKAADAELNQVYALLLGKLTADSDKQLLKKAQRAWLQYRDSNADFEASFYEGGSAQEQIRVYALIRMTQDRTKELKNTIDSEFNR